MPVQYAGIVAEHRAVRSAWGIFDVSHMGRLTIAGPDAAPLLDYLMTADVASLREGRARYGLMCLEDGGILDDVVALREAPGRLLLVCNAANREAVVSWIGRHAPRFPRAEVTDVTLATVMIAVQGPQAGQRLDALLGQPVTGLKRFGGGRYTWRSIVMTVTRTGYTGEDGFECIAPAESGTTLWDALIEAGAAPCGLGARDTLRLEAGLLLHGSDMDRTANPLEAGLERFVRAEGSDFVGKAAIAQARARGLRRRLCGFRARQRGAVPRHGHAILHEGRSVGQVTSGSFSPTLETAIGLGYVPPALAKTGTAFQIAVRETPVAVDVVDLPFYQRPSA
jgi:aminomethyltransferase